MRPHLPRIDFEREEHHHHRPPQRLGCGDVREFGLLVRVLYRSTRDAILTTTDFVIGTILGLSGRYGTPPGSGLGVARSRGHRSDPGLNAAMPPASVELGGSIFEVHRQDMISCPVRVERYHFYAIRKEFVIV